MKCKNYFTILTFVCILWTCTSFLTFTTAILVCNLCVFVVLCLFIWAALREKVPNVLSRCHTKRRTGAQGHARPSFGTTLTF